MLGTPRSAGQALIHSLPRGGTLPREEWDRRHRALLACLWVCAFVVPAYGATQHYPLWHNAAHVFTILPMAIVASRSSLGRQVRAAAVSLGLLTTCALLIHISGGLLEMHFSFFVVIVALTLYEDWVPFLLAVAYVLLHHGIMGTLDPHGVFNRPEEWAHPWKWAGIHALFVAMAGIAGVIAWRLNEDVRVGMEEARREIETMAETDPLTGLANRRKLLADLEVVVTARSPRLVMLFDLDGFKTYNDLYGHLAGDALLTRLGQRLAEGIDGGGTVYRLGGDEFCVISDPPSESRLNFEMSAAAALSEIGDGFTVTSSYGSVLIPDEAVTSEEAMRIADRRMYVDKNGGRPSATSQSKDVLLQVVLERLPELGDHIDGVTELCLEVGSRLGLSDDQRHQLFHAAQLHDIGKVAVPDAIISKPGALDDAEWGFMRQHTVIGERIIGAAPALAGVGQLVRSSHEHYDGTGYPDGLAGNLIPLGARIIAVCDAFDAMVSKRPYRSAFTSAAAVTELQQHAGTQFDPAVVEAFEAVLRERVEACVPGAGMPEWPGAVA